ncbi:hypothetical protein OQ968_06380 [Mycobacterium sp. 663a-19]|uniref:hypothetical protein n=1 Tax=Mycobacterium sp. 663a-19 TaxID=2986148 RepID=UPI002D1E5650|nr:hypothetical protein [Mycobacterium sp. 663a-19]MEB3980887.1 hypothetical protein [Mycobacterium sp. 663a-19]
MSDAENDPPLTVERLADLQAGLLDDTAAARVREQVRADPQAQATLGALNRVRRDVAAAGADPTAAPDAPADAIARITAALTAAEGSGPAPAAHSARPPVRPGRVVAGVAGGCAALAAIGIGTAALIDAPTPVPSTSVTAEHITVSTPPMAVPLSRDEILGLLDRSPDYGPLTDPSRRASCLSGLGYPASTRVLGARPVDINARPGVLLVLPGDTPNDLAVFAVALNCSAADTGLLANTQVPRP